jgi:hypothetical protein
VRRCSARTRLRHRDPKLSMERCLALRLPAFNV